MKAIVFRNQFSLLDEKISPDQIIIYDKTLISLCLDLLFTFGIKPENIFYLREEKFYEELVNIEDKIDGHDIIITHLNSVFLEIPKLKRPPHLYISTVEYPEDNVIDFYGEKIRKIMGTPDCPPTKFVTTGLGVYPNNIFSILKKIKSSKGSVNMRDINNHFLKNGMDYSIAYKWYLVNDAETLYNAVCKTRLERHRV